MTNQPTGDEVREFWDRVAADWEIQVGDEGDNNRRLNSDPVLWQLAGDVTGLAVLDAGCGTGYLAQKLSAKGANVTGVDLSPRMIEIAQRRWPQIDFRVDSCSALTTLAPATFDLIVSNYVLMDVEDLPGAMAAFHRVLKPGGMVVAVFSHPCFPQEFSTDADEQGAVSYAWPFNYFEETRWLGEPWAHFTSRFIWFHRPLSAYWQAFTQAGFAVLTLEEPRIAPERYHLAPDARRLRNSQTLPYSIAFKLKKRVE